MKRTAQIYASRINAVQAILAVCLAISLAGCVLARAPKTAAAAPPAPKPAATPPPAPPPPPLSIPQTNVELPKPQPLDPEALITAPQAEPASEASTASPSARRQSTPAQSPVVNTPPRTETPPVLPQPEPERPPIQEIIPPIEQKRLLDSYTIRHAEITLTLEQIKNRKLSPSQLSLVKNIRSLDTLAGEAKDHGDLRQADALAERAQVLARELQTGK